MGSLLLSQFGHLTNSNNLRLYVTPLTTELEREETGRVSEWKMQEGGLGRRNTNTQLAHWTETLWGIYLAVGVCTVALVSAPWHGSLGWPVPSCPLGSAVLDSAVHHHQEAYYTAGREAAGASWVLWYTIKRLVLKLKMEANWLPRS